MTILVVDDDAAVRQFAVTTLERHGYKVIEADSGPEGVKSFAEHHDDVRLVLSDVVMPKMTGVEMIQRILDIDPSKPVMLMTGFAADTDLPDAVPVLSKPFTPQLLLQAVQHCLSMPSMPVDLESDPF